MEGQNNPDLSRDNEEEKPHRYLDEVYKLVHQKDPTGLSPLEVAERIIEVLDSPNCVPRDLAIRAGNEIMQLRGLERKNKVYDQRAQSVIRTLEEGVAQNLFPQFKNIDELHYSDWASAYQEHFGENA